MPQRGQRTRSSRWRDAHPGRWRKASTGRRGLDIPGMQKPDGQQEAATTKGEYECEKDASSAGVGPPDALKGACPVRVRAGMKPTVERQQGASFDSHRFTDVQVRPTEFLDFTSVTLNEFPQLVPPFEAAFHAHMAAWRLDGKPRTARQFAVYK